MQNRQPRFLASAALAALFTLGPVAAVAQTFPDYLPISYRPFFKHFVDARSLPERMLNVTGLTSGDYGRGFALIAGVAKYPRMSGPAGNLVPAAEDVRKLQNYLRTYEKIDEIVVLTDAEVTPENLYFFLARYFPRRLREFPKSRFLFAYSGHGVTENDHGYLLTSDAVSLNDTFNAIPMTTVRAYFQQVVNSGFHVLALINACYSGEFIKRSFGGDQRFIPKHPGAHAITAGGTKELTWHSASVGTGSVFFEKFFAALDGRAGRDGIVTVDDLAAYLRREVQISTEQSQNPLPGDLSQHGSQGGFFFFNRQPLVESKFLPRWDERKGTPFGEVVPGESIPRNSPPPRPGDNDRQARYATLLSQGDAYASSDDFDSAIADYSEAVRLIPTNALAFDGRGNAYRNKGDNDRAIADHSEAIRLDPTFATAFNRRGVAYANKGDNDRAIADYSEAIRLSPGYSTALFSRAVAYGNKGDHDRAIGDYSEVIRLQPTSANAFYNRGNAYAFKGDNDGAIASYNESMRLNPQDPHAFSARSNAYVNKGDNDRGIEDAREAIRLDPKNALGFLHRGRAYSNKGDNDRGIVDLSEAIRLAPRNPKAFFFRGFAYANKHEYDRAISDYNETIRLDPKDANAFSNRGVAYAHKREFDRAITDFNEAIRLNPQNASAFCNRGVAKRDKGDRVGAVADFNTAKQLSPSGCK